MNKVALILGVTGQDGSYLADILLEKGYRVHGMARRSATGNTRNIAHLLQGQYADRFFLERGDLADPVALYHLIDRIRPHELYNEADQDHVGWSYSTVAYSMDITGAAVGRLLEIVRMVEPTIRVFQPCSSNMFGGTEICPQKETTSFNPQSPYACAKVLAYYLARYYRQTFGLFVSTGILYNHESPRRTVSYVTRKITSAAARIACGKQDSLVLGDTTARIDWGYAKEYMEAAWQMLQLDHPDDFVLATGEAHSVKEFVAEAFSVVGLDPEKYVVSDSKLFRPGKPSLLIGSAAKAEAAFGFAPKVRFKELVHLMVEADLEAVKQ